MPRRDILIVVLLIIIFIITDIYFKNYKETQCTLSLTGKIYDADTEPINLSEYYGYKFFYKKKLYKKMHFIENKNTFFEEPFDKSLVGRCFEVKIDPNNPNRSILILENELSCDSFFDNR